MHRTGQRGTTLLEMMVTMALMTLILGGIVMFLASHARMAAGSFDRTDIQRSGRGALTVLEEKIGKAGMGLPNIKACSDEMQLKSTVGVGTQLSLTIYLNDTQSA